MVFRCLLVGATLLAACGGSETEPSPSTVSTGGTVATGGASAGGASAGGAAAGGGDEGGFAGAPGVGGAGGAGGGEALPECATSTDPLAAPAGMTPHVLTWEQALCGATFPDTGGYPCPIGSWSIDDENVRDHGVAIEFVAPNQLVSLTWVEAQPVAFHGYGQGRPATATFVGISECPIDRRAAVSGSPPADPKDENHLRTACRKYGQSSSIFFGPEPGLNVCGLVPGKTYYLNVLFLDENLDPTCNVGDLCEANFQ